MADFLLRVAHVFERLERENAPAVVAGTSGRVEQRDANNERLPDDVIRDAVVAFSADVPACLMRWMTSTLVQRLCLVFVRRASKKDQHSLLVFARKKDANFKKFEEAAALVKAGDKKLPGIVTVPCVVKHLGTQEGSVPGEDGEKDKLVAQLSEALKQAGRTGETGMTAGLVEPHPDFRTSVIPGLLRVVNGALKACKLATSSWASSLSDVMGSLSPVFPVSSALVPQVDGAALLEECVTVVNKTRYASRAYIRKRLESGRRNAAAIQKRAFADHVMHNKDVPTSDHIAAFATQMTQESPMMLTDKEEYVTGSFQLGARSKKGHCFMSCVELYEFGCYVAVTARPWFAMAPPSFVRAVAPAVLGVYQRTYQALKPGALLKDVFKAADVSQVADLGQIGSLTSHEEAPTFVECVGWLAPFSGVTKTKYITKDSDAHLEAGDVVVVYIGIRNLHSGKVYTKDGQAPVVALGDTFIVADDKSAAAQGLTCDAAWLGDELDSMDSVIDSELILVEGIEMENGAGADDSSDDEQDAGGRASRRSRRRGDKAGGDGDDDAMVDVEDDGPKRRFTRRQAQAESVIQADKEIDGMLKEQENIGQALIASTRAYYANGMNNTHHKENLGAVQNRDLRVDGIPTAHRRPDRLYFDHEYSVLYCPIYGIAVPFHVGCIKTITLEQGTLVIDFFSAAAKTKYFQPSEKPNRTFVSGLVYHCAHPGKKREFERIRSSVQDAIGELKAKIKHRAQKSTMAVDEDLRRLTGPVVMRDVRVRPALAPRKRYTRGNLEVHDNGLCFVSSEDSSMSVNIMFGNIDTAILQRSDPEVVENMVCVHFFLKKSIKFGGRTMDHVQFYEELVTNMSSTSDANVETEEVVRSRRKQLNNAFRGFAVALQKHWKKRPEVGGLLFDVTNPKEAFFGQISRGVVRFVPTKDALVQLVEHPFFVLPINNIEFVVFQGAYQVRKEVEMTIILLGESKHVHISAVPRKSLVAIQKWLTSKGVWYHFNEGKLINWDQLVQQYRQEENFYEEGGFVTALTGGGEEEEEEEEDDDSDSAFVASESGSETESEASSGDMSSDEYDSESEEEEDEEGEDWDALEREAKKADARRRYGK